MMNVVKFILIWLPIVVTALKENDMEMVADVLKSFDKPCNVIANLCWTPVLKKQLMSNLTLASNPKSIKFTSTIDAKDLFIKEKNIFLVDLECPGITAFFQQANSKKFFGKPFRWFILSLSVFGQSVPSELDDIPILPDSEVYITRKTENHSHSVDLVYKISQSRDWIIENYGIWTLDVGLVRSQYVMDVTMPMRRKNLGRETVTTSAVIVDNNSIDNLNDLRYPDVDSVAKSGHRLLSPLYYFMNATRKITYTDTWGYYINGSWNGITGDIYQGKAELSGSVMFITEARMTVLEYLTYPTTASVAFIFREPPLSYQNNLYLLPFKAAVWYCIGSFVVVMIIVIYFNAYWEEKKMKSKKEHDTSVLVPRVSDVTVVIMSAVTQQGTNLELKGALGRFVILIIYLIFLFLYTAYAASIVVLLQSSSDQIRTISDLLQSKLELGVEDTPYNRYLCAVMLVVALPQNRKFLCRLSMVLYRILQKLLILLKNQKDPLRKAIYEKKIAPKGSKPNFYDMDEGIRHLQKKPFAFHCNQALAYKLMEKYFYEHEKCGLREIAYLQDISPWLSCKKDSPYKEIYKIGLIRNEEAGLNDRTNRLIYSKRPLCTTRGGRFVSVSLVDCYPVLLLLLYGMILGVVILLAEVLHHRRNSRNVEEDIE